MPAEHERLAEAARIRTRPQIQDRHTLRDQARAAPPRSKDPRRALRESSAIRPIRWQCSAADVARPASAAWASLRRVRGPGCSQRAADAVGTSALADPPWRRSLHSIATHSPKQARTFTLVKALVESRRHRNPSHLPSVRRAGPVRRRILEGVICVPRRPAPRSRRDEQHRAARAVHEAAALGRR